MRDLFKWSLDIIRADSSLSWLEDRRDEWVPLLSSRLQFLLEGRAFIVVSDDDRESFGDYLIKKINRPTNSRPILPFFPLKALYPNFATMNTREDLDLLDDMLNIVFKNGVVYFYIGSGHSSFSQIAKSKDDSYMWLIDERVPNSFYLESKDNNLDIKLIGLFNLFDKSIDAALFNEIIL